MNTEGHHLILDIWLKKNLDFKLLKNKMADSLMKSGQLILGFNEWEFYPRGESCLFLIALSHASLHTYPEHKYITVDVYSCDDNTEWVEKFKKSFLNNLPIKKHNIKTLIRGQWQE